MQPVKNNHVAGQSLADQETPNAVTVHVSTPDAGEQAVSAKRVRDATAQIEPPTPQPVMGRATVVPKRPKLQPLPEDLQAARAALLQRTRDVMEAPTAERMLDEFCRAAVEYGRLVVAGVTLPEDVLTNRARLLRCLDARIDDNPGCLRMMRVDLLHGAMDAMETLLGDEDAYEENAFIAVQDELEARDALYEEVMSNPLSLLGLHPLSLNATLDRLELPHDALVSTADAIVRSLKKFDYRIKAAQSRLEYAQRILRAAEKYVENSGLPADDPNVQGQLRQLCQLRDRAVADIQSLQAERQRQLERPLAEV